MRQLPQTNFENALAMIYDSNIYKENAEQPYRDKTREFKKNQAKTLNSMRRMFDPEGRDKANDHREEFTPIEEQEFYLREINYMLKQVNNTVEFFKDREPSDSGLEDLARLHHILAQLALK
jgi:hypothetical protein